MSLKIVFMGTPEFAVPSLDTLVNHGYNIAGVVTATDKYAGRGKKKLIQPPVKKYALAKGLRVLQPKNLKSPEFQEELRSIGADLQVVVAFRMLPKAVWSMPRLGTINLHGSLLPKYRGAAPINWAIINGERETGVTTFFLQEEIDTGDLLLQDQFPIGENETAGEVHDRMMHIGAELVLRSVQAIASGKYELKQQEEAKASKAPKIFHETCKIDFNRPTWEVHNFIRGLSPYPAAWTALDDKELKILRAEMEIKDHDQIPGTFLSDNKNWVKVATADGFVWLKELQLQGRKRMAVKDFLNGYNFD